MEPRCALMLSGPALALCFAAAAPQSGSDTEALKKEIEALKQGQAAIQKELQEIKALLKAQTSGAPRAVVSPAAPASPPPFREFVMSLGGADTVAAKGDKKAKVTLVEFSDYECGYCARHVKQTLPEIEKQYVKTGKLRYVFRDFPIASHKLAPKAHEAAACAGDQGKYWEMHDRLFANQTALAATALPIHAEVLGLDVRAFKACLDGGKHAERVRKNLADGRAAGVTGTPAYFLGLTDSDESRLRVTKMIRGAKTYAFFKDAIETLLAQN